MPHKPLQTYDRKMKRLVTASESKAVTADGISNIITSNKNHPAYSVEEVNLHIIYQEELSLEAALATLKEEYGCERITIQSGGTMNEMFLREKLFDYVDIVIAPVLIGGKDTSTLIDGTSIVSEKELNKLGVLRLISCDLLENSYIRLKYKVVS